MDIKVKNLFVRISPTKARPVVALIRGSLVNEAISVLTFTNKKAAPILRKLLLSARAAAKEKYLEEDKLTIKELVCNEGPRLKRHRPGARGRAYKMQKRMTNFYLVVSGEEEKKTVKEEKTKTVNNKG